MNQKKYLLALSLVLLSFNNSFAILIIGNIKEIFKSKAQIKLARAASMGYLHGIDRAIAMGADVNYIGGEDTTPLIWTMRENNGRGFEYLLKKGADPHYRQPCGISVMQYASTVRNPIFLKKLLEYGGDPNTVSRIEEEKIIINASISGRKEQVRLLIEAGADINHPNGVGMTPMMMAAVFAYYDIVYLLLESGADMTKKSYSGRTVISIIEKKNINTWHYQYIWFKKCVRWLRAHGHEVNVNLSRRDQRPGVEIINYQIK